MAGIKTKPGKGEPEAKPGDQLTASQSVDLRAALDKKSPYRSFSIWLVGDTPLIVHAWSQKAKIEMLSKQLKKVKAAGKEARDPEKDFVDSLYEVGVDKRGEKVYGFPTTGLKRCFLDSAHRDKGVARTTALSSLWLNTTIVRVRPAFEGAVCDMPISRIFGSKPEMREDMVKIGSGLTKVASLAYRAQFRTWAIKITGRFNQTQLPAESLAFLVTESGMASGIGEWRNSKNGIFGSFHLASADEEKEWEAYARGDGPLPIVKSDFAEDAFLAAAE